MQIQLKYYLIRLLLDRGADINARYNAGRNALMLANLRRNQEILKKVTLPFFFDIGIAGDLFDDYNSIEPIVPWSLINAA